MTIPDKWGAETLANTTVAADQDQVKVVALDGGGFVIVWSDDSATGADTDSSAVRGRVFDAFGNGVGADFVINTTTSDSQALPDVIAHNGGFVAAWQDSSNNNVVVKRFDAGGQKIGGETQANANLAISGDPSIAALDSGGFAVVWTQILPGDADGAGVYLRRFDAGGTALGTPALVNTTQTNYQGSAVVAAIGGGRFAVAWYDLSDSGDDVDQGAIRLQVFNDDGSPRNIERLVNTETDGFQGSPSIVGFGDGRFIVAWTDQSGAFDGNQSGITGQRFDNEGNKIGDDFAINSNVVGSQGPSALARVAGAGFVAAFSTSDGDAGYDAPDIAARIFDLNGSSTPSPDDVEFKVNGDDGLPLVTTAQAQPSATTLADGRVVIAWHDTSQTGADTSGNAIRFQIIDPRGGQIVGTELGETICGSDASAANQADTMLGLGGNDLMFGFAGDDSLSGGNGNDTLDGGGGADTMSGGDGNDTYKADAADILGEAAGKGTDTVLAVASFALGANFENLTLATGTSGKGNQLGNTITGNGAANTLNGLGGTDILKGLAGNDTYVLGGEATGIDKIADTAGIDLITSTITRNLLNYATIENLTLIGSGNGTGNNLNNVITGSAAANILDGGLGNDTLNGLGGNDILIGWAGKDTEAGGAGNDIFRFRTASHSAVGANADVIKDFDKSGDDRIDLSLVFGPPMTYRHNGAFTAAGQVRINDIAGADMLVEVNTGGSLAADMQIRLANTTLASMTSSDFIL